MQETSDGTHQLQAQLPVTYLKVVPHPSSLSPHIEIIPISPNPALPSPVPSLSSNQHNDIMRPYAPFHTLADFEYTETAVIGLLSKDLVDQQLRGINGYWSDGNSHLTLKSYADMKRALEKACEYVIKVIVLSPQLCSQYVTVLPRRGFCKVPGQDLHVQV